MRFLLTPLQGFNLINLAAVPNQDPELKRFNPNRIAALGLFNAWWTPRERTAWHASLFETRLTEELNTRQALKATRLTLNLWRRGRQISAELCGGLLNELSTDSKNQPLTTFMGTWIAALLGYSHKYRGSKLIETFLGVALRLYLVTYQFLPLTLCVKGSFFNFNFFWKLINAPSNQVFSHPILASPVWDIRLSPSLYTSFGAFRQWAFAMLPEIGRGPVQLLTGEELEFELQKFYNDTTKLNLVKLGKVTTRQTLSWSQVLFMPTRINKPRKAKKARSIRKRLAKRLVRAAGRRFWVS